MRRFLDQYVVAAAAKGGNLATVTNNVRRAADTTKDAGARGPLSLEEWVELAAVLAAQLAGERTRSASHSAVRLAWMTLCSEVDRQRDAIEADEQRRREELATSHEEPTLWQELSA